MKTLTPIGVRRASFALLLCGLPSFEPASGQVPDRDALIRLNRQLLESVFLHQDTSMMASVALPNLVVVPPGGIVENKAQMLAGISYVAMDSVRIDDVTIADQSGTAVVIARVTRLGPPPDGAAIARSRIMSVFVYDDQRWRLLARSITPCIERAVAAGRC